MIRKLTFEQKGQCAVSLLVSIYSFIFFRKRGNLFMKKTVSKRITSAFVAGMIMVSPIVSSISASALMILRVAFLWNGFLRTTNDMI